MNVLNNTVFEMIVRKANLSKYCLYLTLLFSPIISELSAQTDINSIDDIIYSGVNNVLSKYSWWQSPWLEYNSTNCSWSACGYLCDASYCKADGRISIPNNDVLRYFQFGDAAVAFVICHEIGHHIQNLNKYRYNRPLTGEIEADCAAGALMGSLVRENQIHLDYGDDQEMENLAYYVGDYCNDTPHGTPNQRVNALRRGCDLGMRYDFLTAFNACITEFE